MNKFTSRGYLYLLVILGVAFGALAGATKLYADMGPGPDEKAVTIAKQTSNFAAKATKEPIAVEPVQAAYKGEEVLPISVNNSVQATAQSNVEFPKVKTAADEALAKQFSWWPTDAKPAPYKDPDRSGYWWWPEIPGESRPWGNRGFIYVRKIIFDYKSSEGEMKPSLVIKKIIRNVKVYFDYDKSDLRDDAVQVLSKAVYTMESNLKADILITGNADVRGSEQYNQKLGERRAAAVKKFMTDHNIPENRIKILSQGKMNALAASNDLEGMQKDRNAQFMIAEVEEVMIPASKADLFQDKKEIEEKENIEGAIKVSVREYEIKKGDTLWKIAEKEYGNGLQWKRIYEFNRDVIKNPDRPKKGTKIRIPIE